MDNITTKKLESKFPGEGATRFKKIAELGGFGSVTVGTSGAEGGIHLDSENGLDIKGVLDPENKAVTDATKAKIRELAGLAEGEGGDMSKTESSASKMKSGKEK